MPSSEMKDRMLDLILNGENIDGGFFSKSFLITGGAGFLGSWLSEAICKLGGRVTCIDDFSTGMEHNVNGLLQYDNYHLIKKNIVDADISSIDSDFVFHLASRPSPDDYEKHPVESLLPNSIGSGKILEYCRKRSIPVAFASTSETYGDPNVVPTPEGYWGNVNPVGIRSCYDEGKRYAEALFMAYARQYKVPVKIFRIFNTYGPRLRADGIYGRAMSRFLLQASKNDDITIFGDGKQTRSFCYVTDTIRAMMYFAQADIFDEVINIGNPNEISILELARIIVDILGSKSSLRFLEAKADDPKRRCPDISKAKNLLEWHPDIDLRDGIRMTLEWNSNQLHSQAGSGAK